MKKIAMNAMTFRTMEEAEAFAKTVKDAEIIPEVGSWMITTDGKKVDLPLKVWVEYNFQYK